MNRPVVTDKAGGCVYHADFIGGSGLLLDFTRERPREQLGMGPLEYRKNHKERRN